MGRFRGRVLDTPWASPSFRPACSPRRRAAGGSAGGGAAELREAKRPSVERAPSRARGRRRRVLGAGRRPNKALELSGRRPEACEASQPPAARLGGGHAGRPSVGSGRFTGGRQLNAGPLGSSQSLRKNRPAEISGCDFITLFDLSEADRAILSQALSPAGHESSGSGAPGAAPRGRAGRPTAIRRGRGRARTDDPASPSPARDARGSRG